MWEYPLRDLNRSHKKQYFAEYHLMDFDIDSQPKGYRDLLILVLTRFVLGNILKRILQKQVIYWIYTWPHHVSDQ